MPNAIFNLVVLSVSLLCAQSTASQAWQRFSPPDQSFVIELPAKPILQTNKEDSPEVMFKEVKAKSGYAFNVNLGFEQEPELIVGVVHLAKRLNDREFDRTVNDLVLVVSGDDKHFSKESNVIVGPFHGREFLYDKFGNTGRALFINTGLRIHILIFQTDVNGAIDSNTVARVFNSFRPLK